MRTLERNKRKFWYCLFSGTEPLYDENGDITGEQRAVYSDAVEQWANISHATGYAQREQFGQLDGYDKVIVFANPDTPITESTVLFIDKEPEYRAEAITTWTDTTDESGEPVRVLSELEVSVPLYDYTVRRVARSLNSVSIAVSKVRVS